MTETVEEAKPLVARDEKGRLKKGSKLGKGRPKGSRNKATILREKMERKVSIKLSKAGPKVVDKVVDQAIKDGCRQSQKMILDRISPTKKAEDGNERGAANVTINIKTLTRDNVDEVVNGVVIDGEAEVIE